MFAIRDAYAEVGVDNYYMAHANDYQNPHYETIKELVKIAKPHVGNRILDLCCGSGEVTKLLLEKEIIGLDPYMYERYIKETGRYCYPYSFNDLQRPLNQIFDSIICSFALHLCPKSLLSQVLWNLGLSSSKLIVISPNKNPDCDGVSGWVLVDEYILNRVRMKIYISTENSLLKIT